MTAEGRDETITISMCDIDIGYGTAKWDTVILDIDIGYLSLWVHGLAPCRRALGSGLRETRWYCSM